MIVCDAVSPLGSDAKVHVTTPADCEQLPRVDVAETKTTPADSVSVTVIPSAAVGPAFDSVSV